MAKEWNNDAKELFDKVIGNLPQFHRSIAQVLVKETAEDLSGEQPVTKANLIRAFFKEVPPAFKDMMTRLFDQLKIDYAQYINE